MSYIKKAYDYIVEAMDKKGCYYSISKLCIVANTAFYRIEIDSDYAYVPVFKDFETTKEFVDNHI